MSFLVRKVKQQKIVTVLVCLVALIILGGCIFEKKSSGCFYSDDIENIGKISDSYEYNLDENFSIRFLSFDIYEKPPQIFEGQIIEPKSSHKFVAIEMEIKNVGKEYKSIVLEQISWGQFHEIEGDDGRKYSAEYALALFGQINPLDKKIIKVGGWIPEQVIPKAFLLGGHRNPPYCGVSSYKKIRIELS